LITGKNGKIINPFTNYRYEGDFVSGMKHGYGMEDCEEYTFEGNYVVDKKEGEGKIKYKLKDDYYEGNFSNDAINGNGTYIWANKHTYTGNFVDGKMEGKGTYKWPSGEEYTGDYQNNIKMGMGVFKWPNGKIFEGPFVNGNPNGEGKLIYDGKIINAKFIDGKLDNSSLNDRGPKFKRKNKMGSDKSLPKI
jgi:hypothetical protein